MSNAITHDTAATEGCAAPAGYVTCYICGVSCKDRRNPQVDTHPICESCDQELLRDVTEWFRSHTA